MNKIVGMTYAVGGIYKTLKVFGFYSVCCDKSAHDVGKQSFADSLVAQTKVLKF